MRNLPLFPVSTVGSWPRQRWMIQVLRDREAGNVPDIEWKQLADHGALEVIQAQERLGVDIVNDGEQRRASFYGFVGQRLVGMTPIKPSELARHFEKPAAFIDLLRARDVPDQAIKSPIATGELRLLDEVDGLAVTELDFVKQHTSKPVKISLPGPYLLTRSSWIQALSSRAFSEPADLARRIVQLLRDEILQLQRRGAEVIQLDEPALMQLVYGETADASFMSAALPPLNNRTAELELAVQLVNEVAQGIEGVKLAVHVCRGNWSRNEDALLAGSYEPLLPYLMSMNVDQLVLETTTPRAGSISVLEVARGRKEIGLGVVNPRTDEVESPASIVEHVRQALRYLEPEQVTLNPDCGFAPFAERNLNTPETATAKMAAIVQAAQQLRQEFS